MWEYRPPTKPMPHSYINNRIFWIFVAKLCNTPFMWKVDSWFHTGHVSRPCGWKVLYLFDTPIHTDFLALYNTSLEFLNTFWQPDASNTEAKGYVDCMTRRGPLSVGIWRPGDETGLKAHEHFNTTISTTCTAEAHFVGFGCKPKHWRIVLTWCL